MENNTKKVEEECCTNDSMFGVAYGRYPVHKELTANAYQKAAMRTAQPDMHLQINRKKALLLNGLMGLNGEAGEALDIMKKHLCQGHDLDLNHIARELGDVAWYLAISAEAIGYSLEDILQMNIDKLKERYPEGFDKERSIHRAKGDI